jgi:hypothetical protein
MTPGQKAEARIDELGIRSAQELDIEAIAYDAGVHVRYAPLVGCEATLVGFESRAIATIKPSSVRGRERFSVGHELGHWELHRGRSFRCRVDSPDANLTSNAQLEKEADEFSSHLLMPAKLFNPAINSFRWPKMAEIDEVARSFQASQLATLIRMANVDTLPVIVASYADGQRRWHICAPHVPKRWWLRRTLDADTFAYDLVTKGAECSIPRKQSADAWFENNDAGEFEVLEQCYSPLPGQVVVTLYLSDGEMFDRGFDPDMKWRR